MVPYAVSHTSPQMLRWFFNGISIPKAAKKCNCFAYNFSGDHAVISFFTHEKRPPNGDLLFALSYSATETISFLL